MIFLSSHRQCESSEISSLIVLLKNQQIFENVICCKIFVALRVKDIAITHCASFTLQVNKDLECWLHCLKMKDVSNFLPLVFLKKCKSYELDFEIMILRPNRKRMVQVPYIPKS